MENTGAIQVEIDALKSQELDTKELYRLAASSLFFRFGIVPTANRLHQLVGRGSMSTAATVLSRFWKDLRSTKALRLDHPALPEELSKAGGELLAKWWGLACDKASEELESLRTAAQADEERVRGELVAERAALMKSQADAAVGRDRQVDLEQRLQESAADLRKVSLAEAEALARLEHVRQELLASREQAARGEKLFSDELLLLRKSLAAVDSRAASTERRALLEVDRARQEAKDAKKQSVRDLADLKRQVDIERKRASKNAVELLAAKRRAVELERKVGARDRELSSYRKKFGGAVGKRAAKARIVQTRLGANDG